MLHSLRSVLLFIFFLSLAILTGLLLSVPVYKFLHHYFDFPLYKIITRLLSLGGFIFGFLYLRHYGILNKSVAGFKFEKTGLLNNIVVGFLSGFCFVMILESILLLSGVHRFEAGLDLSISRLAIILLKAGITGLVVGLLEESLFRGILQGGLQKRAGPYMAIVIINAIYAAVHFLNFRSLPIGPGDSWTYAVEILPRALDSFTNINFLDKYLSLFAFGVLLSIIRINSGNILKCIGLHAGVIFSIKIIKVLTEYAPGNSYSFLVNQSDVVQGYLSFGFILLICLSYQLYSGYHMNR